MIIRITRNRNHVHRVVFHIPADEHDGIRHFVVDTHGQHVQPVVFLIITVERSCLGDKNTPGVRFTAIDNFRRVLIKKTDVGNRFRDRHENQCKRDQKREEKFKKYFILHTSFLYNTYLQSSIPLSQTDCR